MSADNQQGRSRESLGHYIAGFVDVVRNHNDLAEKVIPFFEKYKLISSKNEDFLKFTKVVTLMQEKQHLTFSGLKKILKLAFSMNQGGRYRKLKLETILDSLVPSETIRRDPM